MLAETLLLSSASWSAFLIFQQVESEQIFYLLLAGNRNKNQTEEESRHGSFLSRESQCGILNYFFLYFFSSFSFLKFPNRAALLFLSAQVISVWSDIFVSVRLDWATESASSTLYFLHLLISFSGLEQSDPGDKARWFWFYSIRKCRVLSIMFIDIFVLLITVVISACDW